MGTTQQAGSIGEQLARRHLETKGYRFITANWRCKMGEVDLIMQDGLTRVFVEVRLRAPTAYGEGVDTIAWQKQRKLIRTAQFYQQKEGWWGDIQFDVVAITMGAGVQTSIEHVPHAFDLTE